MTDILTTIVSRLKPVLQARQAAAPASLLLHQAATLPAPRRLTEALAPGQGRRVIAEIKKASPSRGIIRADFSPLELALELEEAGAAALSVLTEPNYFLGSPDFLRAIAARVAVPVLCKDFIVDPYQIAEARVHGAAAVLLIAALLDNRQLAMLTETAHALQLQVLGEAHDAAEVERLLASDVDLIGVNARNLRTFDTDLAAAATLIQRIPAERRPVAESAIRSAADLAVLEQAGAAGFLIGETLMRAPRPGAALRQLLEREP